MNCPVCNKEMEYGELGSTRIGESFYWAPKEFYEKHYLNPYTHTKHGIEKAGGVCFTIKSRNLDKPLEGYFCRECKKLLIDSNL